MEDLSCMGKRKTGFEYIDLKDRSLSESYQPHCASNPSEVYVAKFAVREDEVKPVVEYAYRLITRRKYPWADERVFIIKDGKHFAVRVYRGEIIRRLREHYEVDWSDEELREQRMIESMKTMMGIEDTASDQS